jgi:two-component system C4-dicarboxylate transport sensor histidine kinase DctB
VLDRNGRAVAASNWQLPTSFVGHRYAFRGYFTQALKKGHAEEFALGAVSRRPGLFLAQRITSHDSGEPIGAVIVKVEFERIEAQWRAQSGQSIVTDAQGIALLTTQPDWRFKPTNVIAGDAWASRSAPRAGPHLTKASGRRFVTAEAAVPMAGWTLLHLQPIEPFEAAAATLVREFLLGVAVVVLVLVGLIVRSRERRQMERESHRRLEQEVARRTIELRTSNEQLLLESVERERSGAALRRAREELAQANRLGIIGQITAGVAHEVNQPAAAIRTFAENATQLLARNDTGRVQRNLDRIVELTVRIGTITAELRSFARRGTPAATAVELSAAIDGALLLLGDPIRNAGVRIDHRPTPAGFTVKGDRVRLEQILVNLVQNALDALSGTSEPVIGIYREDAVDGSVTVTIADNGPGVAPGIADDLFTPFVTGKETGLGLGLGIARDIARDFGGDLAPEPSPLGGAAFALTLRKSDV